MSVRVANLRSLYSQSLYNWNLLQYLGRDPSSYQATYRQAMEASLQEDEPIDASRSRSRTESRRSESRTSRRSRSSTIQPSQTRTAEASQTRQGVPVVPTVPVLIPLGLPRLKKHPRLRVTERTCRSALAMISFFFFLHIFVSTYSNFLDIFAQFYFETLYLSYSLYFFYKKQVLFYMCCGNK